MLPATGLLVKMLEAGHSARAAGVPKTSKFTGFRRFDFRDEFSAPGRAATGGSPDNRARQTEKRTFLCIRLAGPSS
jgi:hypothetical protein